MVAKGDKLPLDVDLMTLVDGNPSTVSTSAVFGGKKVALVTIPGAMTSTCQNSHIPQWIAAAPAMRAKGVHDVVCLAVNDPFVMAAFETALRAKGEITFVADGGAVLTKAIGNDVDTGAFGGVRAKRACFLVDNGVFTQVNVEPDGTGYSGPSKPETLLAQL
ncbi:Peroxiredoxin-2C [Gracilariopsis chorda]|uniref:Peroxiredoxin-2C n=1 Tax=Gracilariopsis chorda TaxID=448386 RepID=A0A2V3IVM3_9FLOR|nr:Peroxiredoxin-2C [Gracilariopsis chorda]|eukprot:PXF46184.1 Peroxiredoxin-2C [Gracilariopsis chorda]